MANRYKVIQGGPYPHLITCTIVRWLPVFISGPYFRVITDSFQYLQKNRGLFIHAYVIMPTHLHAVVTATEDDLSAIMRDFKKFTSRAIYALAEESGNILLTWMFQQAAKKEPHSRFKVWQDEFHPEMSFNEEVLKQKMEYVHMNPVRKELVLEPEKWLYSSASFYADGPMGPVAIDVPEW